MDLKKIVTNFWSNPKLKQVLMLFSVNMVSIPIGILTTIILTRFLGSNSYGDYQFLDNLFNFSVVFFVFGFFNAANRVLVLNKDKQKAKEYYGATLVILLGLFVVMSIVLTLYALFDHNIQQKHLQAILLLTIPFGWVYLLTSYFEALFQADNRMKLLAISRIAPKIGFLISGLTIYFVLSHTAEAWHLRIAWGLYITILALVGVFVVYSIRVSFKNLRVSLREIWRYNKTYGFYVYIGAAFSVGVSQLTGVLISYFGANNSGVGYFSLALSLAAPLQFIPNTIATTNYREFAGNTGIPKKLTQVTLLLTGVSLVALWIIVPPFVNFFFGPKFRPAIAIYFFASAGTACYGIADYYNRYLAANGHGKLLRNTSFIVGSLTLASNLVFIPNFGPMGGAIARLLGGISYLCCMLFYYRKTASKSNPKTISF